MKKLLLSLIMSQSVLAMNALELEFYQNSLELAKLLANQESAMERADDYDDSNNTWLAGVALDDWHKEESSAEKLRQRGRELAEKLPRGVVERICRQAKFDAKIGYGRSTGGEISACLLFQPFDCSPR